MNFDKEQFDRRSERNLTALRQFADEKRIAFLRDLDKAWRANAVRLTWWEQQFITDLIQQPRPLTDAQRDVVDKLEVRFGGKLRC